MLTKDEVFLREILQEVLKSPNYDVAIPERLRYDLIRDITSEYHRRVVLNAWSLSKKEVK